MDKNEFQTSDFEWIKESNHLNTYVHQTNISLGHLTEEIWYYEHITCIYKDTILL